MSGSVYRCYGIGDVLLYVGLSYNAIMRLAAHKKDSEWHQEITRIVIHHFNSRADASDAERDAIRSEHPKYNVQFSPNPPIRSIREYLNAEKIIPLFGGPKEMAKALGHKFPTTVDAWQKAKRIPLWRVHEILTAARKLRLGLKEADLQNGAP